MIRYCYILKLQFLQYWISTNAAADLGVTTVNVKKKTTNKTKKIFIINKKATDRGVRVRGNSDCKKKIK